jgi:hemin uptake protein HemP
MMPTRAIPAAAPHPGKPAPHPARGVSPREAVAARPAVDSEALLGGARSVDIHHLGTVYRLQATRLGKLILTK